MKPSHIIYPALLSFAVAVGYFYFAKTKQAVTPPEQEEKEEEKKEELPPEPLPVLKEPNFKPLLDLKAKKSVTSKFGKFFPLFNSRLTIDGVTYKFLEKLGQGTNGKVKKAINVQTNAVVAIKIITNRSLDNPVVNNLNGIGELQDYGSRLNEYGVKKDYCVIPFVEGVSFLDVLYEPKATHRKKHYFLVIK